MTKAFYIDVSLILAFLFILLAGGLWGCPNYNVWQQGLVGEAAFRRAEQDRKIAIEEAKAKLESAKSLADAEIERARGVAEANKIIGDSLKENEAYLRYLWVQGMQTNSMQVIYIPTEANIPILEASRMQFSKAPAPTQPK